LNGEFDEVTKTEISVTTNTVYAKELDEITLTSSNSVKHRQLSTGIIQVADKFDEFTGAIVADPSLVLWLDAGQETSYPGSGTTWTDLTGRGNNGTLTNGPTFSSANGGQIVFDGTNDYISFPVNLWNHNSGAAFTVSVFFKTSTLGGIILGQDNDGNPATGGSYVPAIYINTSGQLVTSCFWGGSSGNVSTTAASVADGQWKNITVTFASTSHKSYLNGALYATLTKTQTSYGASTYYYFLGAGQNASWPGAGATYMNGSIAYFSFYNKELSAAEVAQNFNALRRRFGI
jgi:hypothetical protein